MLLRTPDAPATSRQLWYLHTLTRTDTRGLTMTMAEASQWITIYQANKVSALIERASPKPVAASPAKVKTSRSKATTKPKLVSNSFKCWYCHDGQSREEHQENHLQQWTLCLGCGATTVDMPRYKMKHNILGGATGISWCKRIPSAPTYAQTNPGLAGRS